jgi:hypothetical protein
MLIVGVVVAINAGRMTPVIASEHARGSREEAKKNLLFRNWWRYSNYDIAIIAESVKTKRQHFASSTSYFSLSTFCVRIHCLLLRLISDLLRSVERYQQHQ